MSTTLAKSKEWLAGFWAASLLFSGRYEDYAAERDRFLDSTAIRRLSQAGGPMTTTDQVKT